MTRNSWLSWCAANKPRPANVWFAPQKPPVEPSKLVLLNSLIYLKQNRPASQGRAISIL